MSTWIAFLRGIGGGIRPLPMPQLKAALENIGLSDVRTYIQSGNVVFRSGKRSAAQLASLMRKCIAARFGFETHVIVLGLRDLQAAAAANPFRQAQAAPTSLHLFFMNEPPAASDIQAMDKLKSAGEAFVLSKSVLYLHTPKGVGVSRLAGRVERLLGVSATARNWRTVANVLEMAQDLQSPGRR